MNPKKIIKYIRTIINFSNIFLKNVMSNNLLVYELREKIKLVELLSSKDNIFFSVKNITLCDDNYIKFFTINCTDFNFDYFDISTCIQNVKLLRFVFKNIVCYYENIYKSNNLIELSETITHILNTYESIENRLTEFKNSHEFCAKKLYTSLIKIITESNSRINNFFVLKNKYLYIYHYKKYDLYEKIKFGKLDLIEIINTLDYSNKSECLILFKKNKNLSILCENFTLMIGNLMLKINGKNFDDDFNIFLDRINKNKNKILKYKNYVENYIESSENRLFSQSCCNTKFIFNMEKCLILKEIYEKYLEFLSILCTDIENLLLLEQINSCVTKPVVVTTYKNIINDFYLRIKTINKNLFNKLNICDTIKNIDVYYREKNNHIIFFGKFDNITFSIKNDSCSNISNLVVRFSTSILNFNQVENNFTDLYDNLLDIKKNIQIIKTMVELNLKNLCDLIYILV